MKVDEAGISIEDDVIAECLARGFCVHGELGVGDLIVVVSVQRFPEGGDLGHVDHEADRGRVTFHVNAEMHVGGVVAQRVRRSREGSQGQRDGGDGECGQSSHAPSLASSLRARSA